MKCCHPHEGRRVRPRVARSAGDHSRHSLSPNYNHLQKKPDISRPIDKPDETTITYTEDCDTPLQAGMQKLHHRTSDAIRKYCAAFPALKKGLQSPLQYCLPPPAWCRKSTEEPHKRLTMHKVDPAPDYRTDKPVTGRERRNSHRGPKKAKGSKKRRYSYGERSESKENLPEWMTHEGVWDAETQDPVREFIRALAAEGNYSRHIRADMGADESAVPDWGDITLLEEWTLGDSQFRSLADDDSYAKFEAKFDSSIEALWSEPVNSPPCAETPVHLRYPTPDRPRHRPRLDECSLVCFSESIWSVDATADVLHDRLKPLQLGDEPTSLYNYDDVYDSVPSVASAMRSLTALNHSKSSSSFAEVLPRRVSGPLDTREAPPGHVQVPPARPPELEEDLLTSARTHFRPIAEEPIAAPPPSARYVDGTSFDISGDLDTVMYRRSESESIYVDTDTGTDRYFEYGSSDREDAESGLPFSLKFRVQQIEKGVQTEEGFDTSDHVVEAEAAEVWEGVRWEACDECSRLTGAKKMRQQVALESIWSSGGGEGWCGACAAREAEPAHSRPPLADEWSQDWEELLTDIGRAHARYAAEAEAGAGREWWRADRKRRHSAAVWCARGARCQHPHDVPFLHCCAGERPLTR